MGKVNTFNPFRISIPTHNQTAMKSACSILLVAIASTLNAQQMQPNTQSELPYYEIQSYPETYSAGNVAARILDGLGFRFYWATEGLRPEDLAFKPSDSARTTEETIQHIYGLVVTIINTTRKLPNVSGATPTNLPFAEVRRNTLTTIKAASDILKSASETDLNQMKVIFQNDDGTREFPFWNVLNGPVDDALWHVGQVITFRRSSGNPYNNKASLFTGKVRK